ncbi:hypothetical protein DN402_01325 [Streptomyces sp. SW4]|nr:hypothetical protein DN402_01325 [Streptomyces sp. SW4]
MIDVDRATVVLHSDGLIHLHSEPAIGTSVRPQGRHADWWSAPTAEPFIDHLIQRLKAADDDPDP